MTADPLERRRLWAARHHLFETIIRTYPGHKWISMDVAVPISAYPDLVAYANQVVDEQELFAVLLGHAGDGNLHVTLSYDDGDTHRRAKIANEAIIYKAIDLQGTSTGEHGVGLGKVKFMNREHGPALDVMAALKKTLDPQGILNPGKIFPPATI